MLDLVAGAFAGQPDLGLLIAEDPHLIGWDENRAIAEALATRMGIPTPLDNFFDFPLGTMFWARPTALEPLLAVHLRWQDYPDEPLLFNGTLLERLLPFVVTHTGMRIGGLRAPGTTGSL